MKNLVLSLPTFGFVVGTRAAVGLTLVAIGVATTILAAMAVFRNQRGTSIQDS